MTLYIIDLFCGAGGFSTGAAKAGAIIAVAVDSWEAALNVHKQHHPKTIHLNCKLGASIKKTTDTILNLLPRLKKTDKLHVHASPPCQQLSLANLNRNEDNGLAMVRWTIKFCKQPYFDSYTIEQVNNPRLRLLYAELDVPFIVCDFSKLGVCQSRRRLIASNSTYLLHQLERINIPFEPFCKIIGKKIKYISNSYNLLTKNPKKIYDRSQPFYTLVTTLHTYKVHCADGDIFSITIPIACKLQGFPENYFNSVKSCQDIRKMIGNAVPTQVGYVIAMLLSS